jgi:hypothetical protein
MKTTAAKTQNAGSASVQKSRKTNTKNAQCVARSTNKNAGSAGSVKQNAGSADSIRLNAPRAVPSQDALVRYVLLNHIRTSKRRYDDNTFEYSVDILNTNGTVVGTKRAASRSVAIDFQKSLQNAIITARFEGVVVKNAGGQRSVKLNADFERSKKQNADNARSVKQNAQRGQRSAKQNVGKCRGSKKQNARTCVRCGEPIECTSHRYIDGKKYRIEIVDSDKNVVSVLHTGTRSEARSAQKGIQSEIMNATSHGLCLACAGN